MLGVLAEFFGVLLLVVVLVLGLLGDKGKGERGASGGVCPSRGAWFADGTWHEAWRASDPDL